MLALTHTCRLETSVEELARSRTRLSKNLEECQIELGQARTSCLTAETELQRRAADAGALERQVRRGEKCRHCSCHHTPENFWRMDWTHPGHIYAYSGGGLIT